MRKRHVARGVGRVHRPPEGNKKTLEESERERRVVGPGGTKLYAFRCHANTTKLRD